MSYILHDYGLYKDFAIRTHRGGFKVKTVEPCSICGSTFRSSRYKGVWYCKKHYSQAARNRLLERTIHDRNGFIIENDTCKIVIRNRNQQIIDYCTIDIKDYEMVKNLKWYRNNHGYCVTKGINPNTGIAIHQVLLQYDSICYCDHIDNDKMNNRRANLRIVTPQENAANMSVKNTNKTGVSGVSSYKADKIPKWDATITVNYKPIYLGRSISFDEAVKRRIYGEAQYFGEYSNNYNPETNMIELHYKSLDDGEMKFISVPVKEELCV